MPAYLDHAATTPMRPEVLDALTGALRAGGANPSGAHGPGRRARRALDEARESIADSLGCRPGEVVLTSGGTEADNLAVRGVLAARGGVAVCPAAEHHAVLEPVRHAGGRVVAVDDTGHVLLDELAAALDPSVSVVSVMAVNNEVGRVTDLAAVADVVRRHAPTAVLHTDAVQAVAWLDVARLAAPADLVTVSGHKVGGPVGVGALVVRDGVRLAAQLLGGGQERERRSGTEDVAGAVALSVALGLAVVERAVTVARVAALRDRLLDGLRAAVPGLVETIPRALGVAGTAHVCVPGLESEALVFLLDRAGVATSAASACASGAQSRSHVLDAMAVPDGLARGALRLSLGSTSTPQDVDAALAALPAAVEQLRVPA